MAYVDRRTGFPLKPAAAVAIVHLAIGYALISGLAGEALKQAPAVFRLINITAPVPPPPNDPPPPPTMKEVPRETVTTVTRQVALPDQPRIDVVTLSPLPQMPTARREATLPAPPPPPASQSTKAQAKGDRGGWITAEDYPGRSLRNGEEGIVAITARIGADGRVSDCTVTASSGFPMLDEATCRLYQRRARFTPARDDAGQPTGSTTTDRIRWTIPR